MRHLFVFLFCLYFGPTASASDSVWLDQAIKELRVDSRSGYRESLTHIKSYLERHQVHMSQTFYQALETFYVSATISLTAHEINDIKAKHMNPEVPTEKMTEKWGGEELLQDALASFEVVISEIDALTIGESMKQAVLISVLLAAPYVNSENRFAQIAPFLKAILQERDARYWRKQKNIIFEEEGSPSFHWSSAIPTVALVAIGYLAGTDHLWSTLQQFVGPSWISVHEHLPWTLRATDRKLRAQRYDLLEHDYETLRAKFEAAFASTPYFFAPVVERVNCALFKTGPL